MTDGSTFNCKNHVLCTPKCCAKYSGAGGSKVTVHCHDEEVSPHCVHTADCDLEHAQNVVFLVDMLGDLLMMTVNATYAYMLHKNSSLLNTVDVSSAS